MSTEKMSATYLVDDSYILHLQEKPEGFDYHCFDLSAPSTVESGQIGWDDMLDSPIKGVLACARVLAIEDIGLEGEKVSKVYMSMLEQFPQGRKLLYQMEKEQEDFTPEKSIRFITSSYDDLFKLPDGGVVEVVYPDRQFSAKCRYIDDYHLYFGTECLHICQLAEMLERSGGQCRPEGFIMADQAAWEVGEKGYLAIQATDEGYDYTFYDRDMALLDGGVLDGPMQSMNEARDQLLENFGWDNRRMTRADYDDLMEKVESKEQTALSEKRESALEKLSGLKSIGSDHSHVRTKEAER